jgi:hypothetical protein
MPSNLVPLGASGSGAKEIAVAQTGSIERARRTGLAGARRREISAVRHASRPGLRLDRVVVAPSGIHVVTAGSRRVPQQRVTGEPAGQPTADPDRDRASEAGGLVAALVPARYRSHVRAVLTRCDEAGADVVDGVLVTSPETLEHVVQHAPLVLSTSEVNEVALRLSAMTEPFPEATAVPARGRWRRRAAVLGTLTAAATASFLALTQENLAALLPW